MKLNWGTGIAIFYTVFVLVLVFAVIQSTKIDNSLVTDDYYQKDLEYQSHIDKEVNALNLEKDLQINYSADDHSVKLQFPNDLGAIDGTILFFRPSNQALDLELPVQIDGSGMQVIPTRDMLAGLWKVKVDWNAGGKAYYKEETIVF